MVEAEGSTTYEKIDVAKILGNPKITFVLGGPASGKGTQCEKLVEEFGYTHISTGDLMRAEMKKGTKEGEEIARIVGEGQLVPYQLTVQVLINALIANPSKNYLIDGFPRALDQAMHFESAACEAQAVLYYNVPEEVCIERCMERAKTSGRTDDNQATIVRRYQNYVDQTKPVISMYERFGKVHEIDGCRDPNEIYLDSRRAVLPQVSFLIGPQGAGKTVLGKGLCERTNMKLLNFPKFVADNNLGSKDDETVTSALIAALSAELQPRVLLEDFPQTEFQAKFFIKNCVEPSRVFVLKCSKDTCQERMFALGENHAHYIPSPILAKRIQQYNERARKLMPFLEKACRTHIIDSEQTFGQTMKQIRSFVEPTIVHVRSIGTDSSAQVKAEIMKSLVEEHDFIELNVSDLVREEGDRRTKLGQRLLQAYSTGQQFSVDMYVQLLQPVIFSGHENRTKFLLNGFPETTEQVQAFEEHCCSLNAIILASDKGNIVDIKNNELSLFNIDSMFQKQFRLKPMDSWDFRKFEEHLGNQINYGLITGHALSGRNNVAKVVAELTNGKVIDPDVVTEAVKKRLLGPEPEGEWEGDVPLEEIQKDICAIVEADRAAGHKSTFLFDGMHCGASAFVAWSAEAFGPPAFWLPVTCDQNTAGERFKAKNEQDDLTEDNVGELKEMDDSAKAQAAELAAALEKTGGTHVMETLKTDKSEESVKTDLTALFRAKIVIVNHAPSLQVDVPCANLAIRYNMLYLSVHQLIREHIRNNTKMGERLLLSRQQRALSEAFHQVGVMDAHDEMQYSAVHFDIHLVMELLQQTIAERRTHQRFILLEGLCNSNKLADPGEQLTLRFMDEFFLIEKTLGEVTAIVSLTFNKEENLSADESKLKWEEFPEPEAPPEKEKKYDDDGNLIEEEEAPAEDAGEEEGEKVAKFKPEDYKWTITNGEQKNLLTLFCHSKGINATPDLREAENYSKQAYQAVTLALDEFCGRIVEETAARPPNLYLQVLFSDQ